MICNVSFAMQFVDIFSPAHKADLVHARGRFTHVSKNASELIMHRITIALRWRNTAVCTCRTAHLHTHLNPLLQLYS